MRIASLLSILVLPTSALAAPIRVAIEQGPGANSSATELAAQLNDDTYADFEATIVAADSLDSAEELTAYDVVIIGDSGNNNHDWTVEMATALDTWVQGGGAVVSVGWLDYASGVAGEALDEVHPIDSYPGGYSFCTGQDSASVLISHPITDGVTSPLPANANNLEGSTMASDATDGVVLGTCDGNNTVVAGTSGNGRLVYLGYLYLARADSYRNAGLRTGEPDQLLEQAVVWAGFVDTDGDGVQNRDDNCPDLANAGQQDGDGDGYGDVCDACDGNDDSGDGDLDGVCADLDCDDNDDTVYPGAGALCDGLVNDCRATDLPGIEIDDDSDGYVECGVDEDGWDGASSVVGGDDCDDFEPTVYPGAPELCDGLINACGGTLPADEADGDADSYVVCEPTLAWDGVVGGADCDDSDNTVYPGAAELCDGIDNDCDGAAGPTEVDEDGDGFAQCELDAGGWDGEGTITGGPDCDDADIEVFPGADGWDESCNSLGCGCSATSGPSSLALGGLLGGLMLLRRRRSRLV